MFIYGLELALFPIGEALAVSLAQRGSVLLLLLFAFTLGFGTTIAEPALTAVAREASLVAASAGAIPATGEAQANYVLGLRVTVALSVGTALVLGVLRIIFGYSPLVYISIALTFAIAWFLKHSRAGLILRAVGESDEAAHSIGYGVIRVRYLAVLFGGAMAGLAGAYYSLVLTPLWADRLTAGRGWIALALVVFASWYDHERRASEIVFQQAADVEDALRRLPATVR